MNNMGFFNPFGSSGSGGGGGGGSTANYSVQAVTDSSGQVSYKLTKNGTAVGDVISFNGSNMLVSYGGELVVLNSAIAGIKEALDKTYNFTTFTELGINTQNKTLSQLSAELAAKNLEEGIIVTGRVYSEALPYNNYGNAEVLVNNSILWWKTSSSTISPYSWNAIVVGNTVKMDWTPTYYQLPIASAQSLGGVKIGDNVQIASDGTISVITTKGDTGIGIASIAKTSSSGLNDTYTITYTDSTTSTFTVTNGATITSGSIGQTGHLILTMSDGRTVDAGALPTDNEVEVTTTSSQPADPNVELWVDLSTQQTLDIPEINDSSISSTQDTWSCKKIYDEQQRQEEEIGVVANAGAKNLASKNSGSGTNSTAIPKTPITLPVGDYICSFSASSYSGNAAFELWDASNSQQYVKELTVAGSNSFKFTVTGNMSVAKYSLYVNNATISDFMIRPAAITDPTFQPYALPNPTLTPAVIKAVDDGAKNLSPQADGSSSSSWVDFGIDIPAGDYVLSFTSLTSTDTDGSTIQVSFFDANDNAMYIQVPRGSNVSKRFTTLSARVKCRVYKADSYAHGSGDTVTFTGCMICTASDWAVSQKFVPYRLSYQQISDAVLNKTPIVYGFHVNPNESDPSAAVTYLLDAVGMAPAKMGSSTFSYGSWKNAFFLPKPCMLKSDGTVDYYLNPNDYTKKSDGTASDVANASYDGNAMMEWPKIWFKYVPGGVDGEWEFYVSNQNVDGTYKCWCNINAAGQEIDHFYTAIYNGTGTTKLRSISGVQLTTANGADNTTRQQEIDRALANNTGTNVMWYTEVWSDRLLINALLYLIGKSLDLQSTFGQGMTSGLQTATQNYYTGGKLDSNSTFNLNNKGLFWGDITNTTNPVKVFGMENLWGCIWRSCAGLLAVDNALKVKLTYDVQDGSTAHGYNLTGNGYLSFGTSASSGYITKMKADPDKGYIASSAGGTGAGASTYYCDYYNVNASGTRYALLGGSSGNGTYCGFAVYLSTDVSFANWSVSVALSCKP